MLFFNYVRFGIFVVEKKPVISDFYYFKYYYIFRTMNFLQISFII